MCILIATHLGTISRQRDSQLSGRLRYDGGRGESRWCRDRGRRKKAGSRQCAAEVLLFLGELSRRPSPFLQSDARRRECAWRRACLGCGHRSALDRSKQSSSLRFFELEAVDFFFGNPEFCQDLLVRNALVMLQPFARFRERFFLFRRDWLVIDGSVSEGTGEGIEHGFEQPNYGGQLRWRKPLDQLVGLLFLGRGTVRHEVSLAKSTALR